MQKRNFEHVGSSHLMFLFFGILEKSSELWVTVEGSMVTYHFLLPAFAPLPAPSHRAYFSSDIHLALLPTKDLQDL